MDERLGMSRMKGDEGKEERNEMIWVEGSMFLIDADYVIVQLSSKLLPRKMKTWFLAAKVK